MKFHYKKVLSHFRTVVVGVGVYPSAEMQSVYYTTPTNSMDKEKKPNYRTYKKLFNIW